MSFNNNVRKVFTYVSPKTDHEIASGLCGKLPIILIPTKNIQSLYVLLTNSSYHTDFIVISIEMFNQWEQIDMFDVLHTLTIIIKTTGRDTKIMVLVDEDTDPKVIREVINSSSVTVVSMILKDPKEFNAHYEHISRVIAGDYSPFPQILELIKPKKSLHRQKEEIILTPRQMQILRLLQERGCSNKTIGKMLKLSESTVKLHVGAILKKYGLKNRTQLALLTIEK